MVNITIQDIFEIIEDEKENVVCSQEANDDNSDPNETVWKGWKEISLPQFAFIKMDANDQLHIANDMNSQMNSTLYKLFVECVKDITIRNTPEH